MNRAAIIAHLEQEEAFSPLLYDDATGKPLKMGDRIVGHPTVGIGLALDVEGLTLDEARYLCGNRIEKRAAELDRRIAWWRLLSDTRQLVLISMAYQMGVVGLMGFVKFIAALKRNDWTDAARQMLDSKWAEADSPARAQRLAKMMEEG